MIIFAIDWYSVESYYMVNLIMDFVPNIAFIIIQTSIYQIKYKSMEIFFAILLANTLTAISFQSIGRIVLILFQRNSINAVISITPFLSIYSSGYLKDSDLSDFEKHLIRLSPIKSSFIRIYTFIYGSDRCPDGQSSAFMTYMGWTDNMFDNSLYELIIQSVLYLFIAYLCIKIKIR